MLVECVDAHVALMYVETAQGSNWLAQRKAITTWSVCVSRRHYFLCIHMYSLYHLQDTSDGACRPCGSGKYFAPEGDLGCYPCEPGSFCDDERCVACQKCDYTAYQDDAGRSSCKTCPPNTVALRQGAESIGECICAVNYYRRDGQVMPCGTQLRCCHIFNLSSTGVDSAPHVLAALQTGKECFPCPAGGICLGGTAQPYPSKGHWGDWALVDESVPDSAAASKVIACHATDNCQLPRISPSCTVYNQIPDLAMN